MSPLFWKVMAMRLVGLLLVMLVSPQDVRHRFLATDGESSKLIYVDQFHPEKDWTVETPKGPRDLRRVDDKTILMSHRGGAAEYDLETGKQTWIVNGFREVHAAIRLATGRTLLVGQSDKGVTIFEVDRDGKEIGRILVEGKRSSRNAQRLDNGNILLTSGKAAIEVDGTGKIVWEAAIPGSADDIDRLENGLTVVPTGSGGTALYLDKDGKVVATRGGKEAHPDLKINWFAATQTLPNGNLVVANWLGHKPGLTGPHVLEFDAANRAVWKWEDARRVQTLHNVLVLE
jgi:putative pyrroloquinoline-quinone binding quinoprotein